MKRKMVLGFMFSESRLMMALIQKRRPEWQAGKLNGVGGKVEPVDSDTHAAMRREFREETGVDHEQWDLFLQMEGDDFQIDCFRCFTDKVNQVKSPTDEKVWLLAVGVVRNMMLTDPSLFLANIQWVVPLALDNLRTGWEAPLGVKAIY